MARAGTVPGRGKRTAVSRLFERHFVSAQSAGPNGERKQEPLYARENPKDFRLPDFTASFEGDVYYWEHLGMLTVPSYREAWERKRKWYESNGYAARLVTSEDGPDGGIDAAQIERIARARILE